MGNVVSIRLEASLLSELDRICKEEGKSRTTVIKEALRYYLQYIRSKSNTEGFVPFSEYRQVNEELKEALRKIAELEALLAEVKKEKDMLTKKRRWFF